MPNRRPGSDNQNNAGNDPNRSAGNNSRRNPARPGPDANTPGNPRRPDPAQINFGSEAPPPSKRGSTYRPIQPNNRNRRTQPPPTPDTPPPPPERKPRWSQDQYQPPIPGPNVPLQPNRVPSTANPTAPARPRPRRRFGSLVLYFFLTVLVVGGLVALYLYTRLASFTNGITVQKLDVNNKPVSSSGFNGHDSVNIALLGLDTRPGNPDGTRSDTIIVVRVNPQTHAASMLSIPRDLWVSIPGHDQNRINAAYTFGDAAFPGSGGPPLVKATIEQNFGLHIDNFAQVDFEDFEQVINAIGGVTIDVPKPLIDDQFPTLDYGFKRIYIPAGIQHMDGQTAVEYARSRHSDSDAGRNLRQQQVLTAIREQGINLPNLLTNNRLQASLQQAIKTDLQQNDILGMAQLAVGLNKSNIHNFAIDFNLAVPTDTGAGNVLMSQWDAIHALVKQFVSSTDSAQAPAVTTAAPAHIKVLNGTYIEGRAALTQKYLESKGFNIVGIDQAPDAGNYPTTVITVYNNRQDIAMAVATALGVSNSSIRNGTTAPPGVDVEVICGGDLKLPNP